MLLLLLSKSVLAQNCEDNYFPVLKKLTTIHTSLQQVHNRQAYYSHVKKRYEDVTLLLFMAQSCSQDQQLSGQQKDKWRQVAALLLSFQSSAKSSAFTDFEDWLAIKDNDINAYNTYSKTW